MTEHELEIQQYFDQELSAEDRIRLERELLSGERHQQTHQELGQLHHLLQDWELPAGLEVLREPLVLPIEAVGGRLKSSLRGWLWGLAIAIVFMMLQAVFTLSGPLTWLANFYPAPLAATQRISWLSILENIALMPFYWGYLRHLSDGFTSALALFLPQFLYLFMLCVIAIAYFSWLGLIWRPKSGLVNRRSS